MIPYVTSLITTIAGQELHWFGVLVALAVIVGDRLVIKQGAKMGLDEADVKYVNARIVIGGFIVAHWVSVIFYFPERIREDPKILLYFWSGLSSYGGFFGAAATFFFLMRREKLPARVFADAIALGLAPAWILGRAGCFTAHDHPGPRTDFFLGVRYPEGTRHDLGFYEMLYTIALTAVLYAFARKRRPPGAIIGLAAILYAPVRFGLDFLRLDEKVKNVIERPDQRYFGLTPAQYASVGCLLLGIWLMRSARFLPPAAEPGEAASQPAA